MVVRIEVEIGHQLGLHVVDRFGQRLEKFVKILFVEEDLVPVIAVLIEFLTASVIVR